MRSAETGVVVAGGRAARENGIEVCSSLPPPSPRNWVAGRGGRTARRQEGGDLGNNSLTLTIHERGDGGSISAAERCCKWAVACGLIS